ncbi:MAG: hypothetical protein EOP06_11730 [Proteobacteria bacterium]|nr:MAG: hypothetical protein EOP06_11730 [Pseudomonadota bacterium]
MKDDLSYTPTSCFQNFPLPINYLASDKLEGIGEEYYKFRDEFMRRTQAGLTKIYNLFHDPNEDSFEIRKFRELQTQLDLAVLNAYGWRDILPKYEFHLDYAEDDIEGSSSNKRKKPWRFRWDDSTRDEILSRLLALNAKRAEEEKVVCDLQHRCVIDVILSLP